jgi:3-dehydroquinate synthase
MSAPVAVLEKDGYSRLRVDLGERGYDILIGEGLLTEAGRHVVPLLKQGAVIVTDSNVAKLHLATLQGGLERSGMHAPVIELEPGEHTKDFRHLEELCNRLLDLKTERNTALIALGGGVIGDLTGFAAAIVLRGIPFIQIPTTLLAQVDSSVGGKTAIDMRQGKNLVGAFYQPRLVLADVGVLETLPRRELLAGYAEVVKYGLIEDAAFFDWLESNGEALVKGDRRLRREAVMKSCAAKTDVVIEDEREAGRRALLNFGHTFGHALETETGFGDALLHGEAVAIGMVLAFELSARLGLCPFFDAERARRHMAQLGLPVDVKRLVRPSWTVDRLIGHMMQDKKVQGGTPTFILARGIGKAFISRDVPLEALKGLLRDALTA